MPHPADFIDAHHRHRADAKLLFEHGRWANADQLYGFSSECGLKAVMKACGMAVDPTTGTPLDPQYRKHIQEVWPLFQSFVETLEDAEYLDRLPPGEPFADWSHHDRYAHGGYCGRPDVEAHRDATDAVAEIVEAARQNGLT